MADELAPSDKWPNHSRPLASDALREAAKAGWYFRKSKGHIFGKIRCPAVDDPTRCVERVFSTSGPADGSATLRAIRKALRACPHGAPDPLDGVARSESDEAVSDDALEARFGRLLTAADGLLRRVRAEEGIAEALEMDDEEGLVEHDRRLVEADNAAQMALSQLGRTVDPWPPEVGRRELLREALQLASGASDPELSDRLTSLVADLDP